MTYKILSKRQVDDTIFTEVEFNFDGEIVICDIPHFRPASVEEIENSIYKRSCSELIKIQPIAEINIPMDEGNVFIPIEGDILMDENILVDTETFTEEELLDRQNAIEISSLTCNLLLDNIKLEEIKSI